MLSYELNSEEQLYLGIAQKLYQSTRKGDTSNRGNATETAHLCHALGTQFLLLFCKVREAICLFLAKDQNLNSEIELSQKTC